MLRGKTMADSDAEPKMRHSEIFWASVHENICAERPNLKHKYIILYAYVGLIQHALLHASYR